MLFQRAKKVLSFRQEKNSLYLELETIGYLNRLVQTHETQMFQLKERIPEIKGKLFARIDFWTGSLFRVRYGTEEVQNGGQSISPLKTQMLVGKPANCAKFQVSEEESLLRIRTSQIELRISKDVLHMQAFDTEEVLFWEQARSDLFTSDIFDISVVQQNDRTVYFESFYIEGQEEIYGLGERFDHVSRKGATVDFWNKDAIGTSNRRT